MAAFAPKFSETAPDSAEVGHIWCTPRRNPPKSVDVSNSGQSWPSPGQLRPHQPMLDQVVTNDVIGVGPTPDQLESISVGQAWPRLGQFGPTCWWQTQSQTRPGVGQTWSEFGRIPPKQDTLADIVPESIDLSRSWPGFIQIVASSTVIAKLARKRLGAERSRFRPKVARKGHPSGPLLAEICWRRSEAEVRGVRGASGEAAALAEHGAIRLGRKRADRTLTEHDVRPDV